MKYFIVKEAKLITLFIAVPDHEIHKNPICLQVVKIGSNYHIQTTVYVERDGEYKPNAEPITKQEFETEYDNAINSFMPFLS